MNLTIRSYSRLHITLLDLAHATPRRYGGAGISLASPRLEISATAAKGIEVENTSLLDAKSQSDLMSTLKSLKEFYPEINARLTIKEFFPQHVGLGSKTSLVLAALTVIARVSGIKLSRGEMLKISRRGGTSGIGIHSFFNGGFIIDGGHPDDKTQPFAPSSYQAPIQPPPLIARRMIPRDWVFHLLLPESTHFSGDKEVDFFRTNTPVPQEEVWELIALTYHGLLPAFLFHDIDLLRRVLWRVQRLGFKAREFNGQTAKTREIHRILESDSRLAVGLSSIGPLIFAVSAALDMEVHDKIAEICAQFDAHFLGSVSGRNQGFEIIA